jgi:hypothetical protein
MTTGPSERDVEFEGLERFLAHSPSFRSGEPPFGGIRNFSQAERFLFENRAQSSLPLTCAEMDEDTQRC